MKTLSTSLGLILILASSQSAFASQSQAYITPVNKIEKIVVIAKPEAANFEIYSEKHSRKVMYQMVNIVIASVANDKQQTSTSI